MKHSGWRGRGSPLQVGIGYTSRKAWSLGASRQEVSDRIEMGVRRKVVYGLRKEPWNNRPHTFWHSGENRRAKVEDY